MSRLIYPCALILAAAAVAAAGVNVQIDPNAKTQGTVARPGETDTYRFSATAGADFSFTLKAKKKSDLDFDVLLVGPGPVEIDLSQARKVKDKGGKLQVKGLVLPTTGDYALLVGGEGEGTGDYTMRLRAKAQTRFTASYPLDSAGDARLVIPVPPGSDVTIRAKASTGADPRLGEPTPDKAPSDDLKVFSAEGGDLEFVVANDGEAGTVDVKVKVKPPKLPLDRVDVRAETLGEPDGGETALSETVSAADGGAVTVVDATSALFGAGVDIPPGGLLTDTRITLTSSTVISVPVPGSQRSAGPAMEFGPDGLQFQTTADVTIPFDPSAVPPGANPEDVVRVVRQSSDGSQEVLVPSSVDMDAGIVTAATSGFSRFMAFVPRGRPNLAQTSYWDVAYTMHFQPDDGGTADSRRRDLSVGAGVIDFLDATMYARTYEPRSVGFDHATDGTGIVYPTTTLLGFDSGTWAYDPGGQSVILTTDGGGGGFGGKGLLGGDPTTQLDLSIDGRALVGMNRGSPDPSVEVELLVRRATSPQTLADLAGTYHLVGFSVDVVAVPTEAPVPLFLARDHEVGTLTIGAGGSVAVVADAFKEGFDPFTGRTRTDKERFTGSATLAIDPIPPTHLPGSFLMTRPDGHPVRILPSDDGRILIGVTEDDGQSQEEPLALSLFVAVRRGTAVSEASLVGPYSLTIGEITELRTYAIPGSPGGVVAPDLVLAGERTELVFDGTPTLTGLSTEDRDVLRDDSSSGVSGDLNFDAEAFAVRYRMERDGSFRSVGATPAFVGAISQNGLFGLFSEDPRERESSTGLGLLIQLPPRIGDIAIDR